jgi:hypothetical protein
VIVEEKILRERLTQLSEALTPAPLPDRGGGAKGTYVSRVPAPSGRSIEELLDHVRLQTKYLMFDLEATRRENRYLRQMLARRTNFGDATAHL